jgi:hypothetical protein
VIEMAKEIKMMQDIETEVSQEIETTKETVENLVMVGERFIDATAQIEVKSVEEVALDVQSTKLTNYAFNPSEWSITPFEEGIQALNNVTGEIFSGSVAEFNTKIRSLVGA